MRLFVRAATGKITNFIHGVPSKVVAVHKGWTFETLLQKIGHKFDIQVGDVSKFLLLTYFYWYISTLNFQDNLRFKLKV